MKKFFIMFWANIKCAVGKHDYQYLCGNYHSRKDVFRCKNCDKHIEQ